MGPWEEVCLEEDVGRGGGQWFSNSDIWQSLLEGLLRPDHTRKVSDSIGLGCSLGMCMVNRILGDAVAAGLGTTTGEPVESWTGVGEAVW